MRAIHLLGSVALVGVLLSGCVPSAKPAERPVESEVAPLNLDEMRSECVRSAVQAMPVEEQIRSVLMLHVSGLDRQSISSVLATSRPGGLIAMGDNIAATPQDTASVFAGLTAPVNGVELPIILAVDQEGGFVNRIPQDTYPAGAALHEQPPETVQQAFADRAVLVRESGLNTNFGIVADFTDNPDSFIYSRVLGVTPETAATSVSAAVAGERDMVMSALKHFPGHGATELDSHYVLPTVTMDYASWMSREALPFAAGIRAGAEMVMMGHLIYSAVDALPASQSRQWVTLLREDLSFEGIIITDDMRMLEDSGSPEFSDVSVNSIRALQAGISMLLFVGPSAPGEVSAFVDVLVSSVAAAVQRGELSISDLEAAAAQVYEARRNLVDSDPRSWCSSVAGEYSVSEPSKILEE